MPPQAHSTPPPTLPDGAEHRAPFQQWLDDAARSSATPLTQHEALGLQIRKFYQFTRPSKSEQLAREGLTERIQELIRAQWPDANIQISVFGSSSTDLHTPSSDIDLVLLDPDRPLGPGTPNMGPLPEWYDVRKIAQCLRRHAHAEGFTDVRAIPFASVPIASLKVSGVPRLNGVKVDIAVNNRFGVANSDLIKAYADLQPDLLRPLCLTVKKWLKERGLNEPAPQGAMQERSLSSYTAVLLVIAYLQATQRLPNLQDPELLRRMWLRPRWLWSAPQSRPKLAGERSDSGLSEEDTEDESDDEGHANVSGPVVQVNPKHDVIFFHPFSPYTKRCSIRKIQDPGHLGWMRTFYYRKRRIPPTLHDWLHNYDDIRSSKPRFKGLPTPEGVGLHQKSSPNVREADAELGSCLLGFIDWILTSWRPRNHTGNVCFDIASTRSRRVNTLREIELWGMWKDSADQDAAVQPNLDVRQPAEWARQPLVVPDPFVQERNTARNIKDGVAHDLQRELLRAQAILRSASGPNLTKLFENIAKERPYITDGGAETLNRLLEDMTISSSEGQRRTVVRGSAIARGARGSRGRGGAVANPTPTLPTSASRGRGGRGMRGGRGTRPG